MVYPLNDKSQYCAAVSYPRYPQDHLYRTGAKFTLQNCPQEHLYGTGAKFTPYYNQTFTLTSNTNYTATHKFQSPFRNTGYSKSAQTLRDISRNDLNRLNYQDDNVCLEAKTKTELCKNFLDGKVCPFGSRCRFAHGHRELKQRSLMDLKKQGLVEDIDSYRTRPCFTWISTGSCPFNSRCKCLHDSRAKGSTKSWLPHVRMPESSLLTDVNVDNIHHLKIEEIHRGSPFGSIIPIKKGENRDDSWSNLYNTICNIERDSNSCHRSTIHSMPNITESHRIEIAMKMYHKKGDLFTYQPSHLLFGDLCMVVQTRTFRILDLVRNGEEVIEEVDNEQNEPGHYLKDYRRKTVHNVVVREITFGSAGDSSVRKAGLWFDLPEKSLSICSHKQAKQIQKKINSLKIFNTKEPKRRKNESELVKKQKNNPFQVFHTSNNDAYDLIQNILLHQASVLRSYRGNMKFELKQNFQLKAKETYLKSIFENLMMHSESWSWPINEGREKLDVQNKENGIPTNDTNYNFSSKNKIKFAQTTSSVWNSAVNYLDNDNHGFMRNSNFSSHKKSKLKVFQDLREMNDGKNISTIE